MKLKVIINKGMEPMSLSLLFAASLLACTGNKPDTGGCDTGDCGGGDGATGGATGGATEPTDPAAGYYFPSAFEEGRSSVAYSGQTFRQLLIDDMRTRLEGMTERIEAGGFGSEPGDVEAELEFYLDFDSSVGGAVEHTKATAGEPLQRTYDDVASGKDLAGKIAGNDPTGQYRDWSTELVGWGATGSVSPEGLVRQWIAEIDALAVSTAAGSPALDPSGAPVDAVYITAEGQDLRVLLESFLRGAIGISQGVDDYLDDDIEGMGLLADHTGPEEGEPFTVLEHAWDEAFGYFGAARTYADWPDQEIVDPGSRDADGDGYIDLLTEVSWGYSVTAAERDLGSAEGSPTDLSAAAWEGFHRGRLLLSETAGTALSAAQLDELRGYRDAAVGAWDQVLAATAVHWANAVLRDMGELGGEGYRFADHAAHWSALKGSALSMQFNPRSSLSAADIERIHQLLGTAPELDAERLDAYAEGLREVKTILADAYSFAPENMGDDDGTGGW